MYLPIEILGIYLELFQAAKRRQRPLVAVRFLVLSMGMACELKLDLIARYCQQLILSVNPHHLVNKWRPGEGMDSEELQAVTKQLLRKYPLERAERLLDSLNIVLTRQSEAFASDEEFAASLLGLSPDEIRHALGDPLP